MCMPAPFDGFVEHTKRVSPTCLIATYNADMKKLYDRLTGKGKPHKVAVVAVMRKLIILANVLVREDREWTPLASGPISA